MVAVIVRALQSGIAVIAGITTASRLGDGDIAKLAAFPIAALAAILIEYGLAVAPKRSRRIRRGLDVRAVFEGVWIQNVKKVVRDDAGAPSNRFAVFTVTHSDDRYSVQGTAYDRAGKELSSWHSTEQVHFSTNGRSMTYLWRGTVIADGEDDESDRTGFANLQLSSDDSGSGRVDHVSMQVTLIFNLQRVTQEVMDRWKPGSSPDLLRKVDERDRFALDYAERLAVPSL